MKPKAVVLLSGGIDSSVALAMARAEGNQCHALIVDYGQRHSRELAMANEQGKLQGDVDRLNLRIDLSHLGTPLLGDGDASKHAEPGKVAPTYVPARNTVLLSLALGYAETLKAHDIYIGANGDDEAGYPDCRRAFFDAFEHLAETATKRGVEGHKFRVRAPLIKMRKREIVKLALNLGVDLAKTSSCYNAFLGMRTPAICGNCDACRLRAQAFIDNGLVDPLVLAESFARTP